MSTDLSILSNLHLLVSSLSPRTQTLDDEQRECLSTCMDTCRNISYPSLGLIEEVSEYIEKLIACTHFTEEFSHTQYANALAKCLDEIICAGREIGRINKLIRHGQVPDPLRFDAADTAAPYIPALRFELGDIRWMVNVADAYLHLPTADDYLHSQVDITHAPMSDASPSNPLSSLRPTAQLTSDLRHHKLLARQHRGTIDAQGDASRTPITD